MVLLQRNLKSCKKRKWCEHGRHRELQPVLFTTEAELKVNFCRVVHGCNKVMLGSMDIRKAPFFVLRFVFSILV